MFKDFNYIDFKDTYKNFYNFICKESNKDHNYYTSIGEMLSNRLNIYVNYINFREIYNFFKFKKNLKVLDLGCGIGDKSILIKKFLPSFDIYGMETKNFDDPEHIENRPDLFYDDIYPLISKKYDIKLKLYNGLNLPFEDDNFDIILLYAVIEHISPEKRSVFINTVEKKLKKGGYIVVTRCPQYYGLMEFLSRKLGLGAHEWVLKRKDLLELFSNSQYSVEVIRKMNNIPNNYSISKVVYKPLVYIDKILSFVKWPFSTDYFLIVRKIK